MSTPTLNTQLYISVAELTSLGLSQQFLNSPLLTSPVVNQPWVAETTFGSSMTALITPLTWGAVVFSGTGPPTAVSFSGAPFQPAPLNVQVEIDTGGVLGTATFQFSTDGGFTWSGVYTTAASVQLEATGIIIAFAAATYVSGDLYTTNYTGNGLIYAAQVPGGTTGATQPIWPTQIGATVYDGAPNTGVTWLCIGANNAISIACLAGSEEANKYIGQTYKLPLVAWGFDLKLLVADLVAYRLARVRGYNPAIPAEDTFRISYEQTLRALRDVANRKAQLDVVGQNSQEAAQTNPTTGPVLRSPALPHNYWSYGTRGSNQR
jgi:phage gp36-like protein